MKLFQFFLLLLAASNVWGQQSVAINPRATGPRFEGIGVVNGGGATAVLLKDYPEPQRSQILDLVYRPKFGASVSALLVEIPGDGNATQGSMPSHRHTRDDLNYHRGYTWWLLSEVARRNPAISLDATAWSVPGWVGLGDVKADNDRFTDSQFWSQDAADYYVSWLRGLREIYGLELTALGCRNEKGENYDFAKLLRRTLDREGFAGVRLHAFDNWYPGKLHFVEDMRTDSALRQAIDIVGGHVFNEGEAIAPEVRQWAKEMGKPIWNTEDHVYRKGFDCLISLVECFNRNYILNGVTRITNWYDIAGIYPLEPYAEDPPTVLAYEPWSGHYEVREALWGYAHYGQFTAVGWHYVDSGCTLLDGGGTMVTLASPDGKDYPIIIETKHATQPQQLRLDLPAAQKLCVWRSTEEEQFVRQPDITATDIVLTLQSNAVYSLSTTTGQQKGHYEAPSSKSFPFPYADDFEGYDLQACGYLPRYTADICGAFELTPRPDGQGTCLRQAVPMPTLCWAPDWKHYSIIGDATWTDYQVEADILLQEGDAGGVMGRICHVGTGYGFIPKGYYLMLTDKGRLNLVCIRGKKNKKQLVGDAEQQAIISQMDDESEGGERLLATCQLKNVASGQWHRLTLSFQGNSITALVDSQPVLHATDSTYSHGMAGLLADTPSPQSYRTGPLGQGGSIRTSTPCFDNLRIGNPTAFTMRHPSEALSSKGSGWVDIVNGQLWTTDKGETVQAHAPGFVRKDGLWYMVGEDRSHPWNPDVNLYASPDLVHWTFVKKIIENGVTDSRLGRSRMIERAKLLYCEKTGKYVVWCHWESKDYSASEASCFVSDAVDADYRLVWSGRPMGIKSRDCNVFVDHDGTAYFISTTNENQDLGLFRLADDYLSVVEHTCLFPGEGREAPAISAWATATSCSHRPARVGHPTSANCPTLTIWRLAGALWRTSATTRPSARRRRPS